jgi:hypothetical protein
VRGVDPDLLTALSMLVGAVGLIYGTWHAEISEALHTEVRPKRLDRGRDRAVVLRAHNGRALPVAIAAWVLVAIFTPTTVGLIVAGVRRFFGDPTLFLRAYDPVPPAFIAVYLVAVVVAVAATVTVHRLRVLLHRLDAPDEHP